MRNEKCGMRNELTRNAERELLSFELGPSSPVYTLNSELRTQNVFPRPASLAFHASRFTLHGFRAIPLRFPIAHN
jgi:hypothetical protein